jgi:hypothetical protein
MNKVDLYRLESLFQDKFCAWECYLDLEKRYPKSELSKLAFKEYNEVAAKYNAIAEHFNNILTLTEDQ